MTPVRSLADLPGKVRTLAWSPDGRHLAIGGNVPVIHVWDRVTDRVCRFTPPHENTYGLAWSPDGSTLAAASHLRIVEPVAGPILHWFRRSSRAIRSPAWPSRRTAKLWWPAIPPEGSTPGSGRARVLLGDQQTGLGSRRGLGPRIQPRRTDPRHGERRWVGPSLGSLGPPRSLPSSPAPPGRSAPWPSHRPGVISRARISRAGSRSTRGATQRR